MSDDVIVKEIVERVLPPVVIKKVPGIQCTTLTGETLPVQSINMSNGEITSVILSEEVGGKTEYTIDEIFVQTEFLNVPGVGHIPSGAMIRYHEKDYLLLFGWHTNTSNQTIYSWYMLKDKQSHTVYADMINEIDLIQYC